MNWKILTLGVGVLLAGSAAVTVFAGPDDTTPTDTPPATEVPTDPLDDPSTVTPEATDEPTDAPDDGDAPDADGDVDDDADGDQEGDQVDDTDGDDHGQRDLLGIPEQNMHPCDNTGGCDTVPHPSGGELRLPRPAAEHRQAAPARGHHDGDTNDADDTDDADDSDSEGNHSHGPPHDVPRGHHGHDD